MNIKSRLFTFLFIPFIISACQSTSVETFTPIPVEASSTIVNPSVTPVESTPIPQETSTLIPAAKTQSAEPTVTPQATMPPEEVVYQPREYPIGGIELHTIAESHGLGLFDSRTTYWIRRNGLSWANTESVEGERNWNSLSKLDEELITASSAGFTTILIVRQTPDWAQRVPGKLCGPIRPEKLNSFGDFMYDLVTRYSQPPYNVKYWELGNEPDTSYQLIPSTHPYGCWGMIGEEFYGGGYYAEMLKAVYPKIKTADPEAQVLIGGLLLDCDPENPPALTDGSGNLKDCSPTTFFEGILNNEGGDYFDGVSFHAYDYYYGSLGTYGNFNWESSWDTTGPVIQAKTDFIRQLLQKYNSGDKLLLNTETAILCGSTGEEDFCQAESFDRTKEIYIVHSFVSALEANLDANIWFSITGWRESGLAGPGYSSTKPLEAFNTVLSLLSNANYVSTELITPNVIVKKFLRQDDSIWVAWSLRGSPQEISTPPGLLSIKDIYGANVPVGEDTLTITNTPIYLFFDSPE